MTNRLYREEDVRAIADSIRAKNGQTAKYKVADMAEAIAAITTGGGSSGGGSTSVKRGFANFVDHDGTVIQSLTRDEVAALTAMPDGPTHDGLTFQGWNYTLDALKAAEDGADVGATYVTSDVRTHMGVLVSDESRATAHVNFTAKVDGGVTIAWGDGSTTTSSGTSNRSYEHTYAAAGEYDLTLSVADGCTVTLGSGSNSKTAFGEATSGERNMLQSLRIGGGVTSIGGNAFNGCYSLASVTIPQGVTSIGAYAFLSCYSLASVTIPQGVTSIGGYAFQNCYSLASVTIPQGVTSIGGYAFNGCTYLGRMVLEPETPPTLTASIGTLPTDCIVLVPADSWDAYTSASHWSDYAAQMRR